MDIHFMRSAAEDQMAEMMLMMQMEKLHDYSCQDPIIMELNSTNHHNESDHNNINFIENLRINSPTFMDPQPSINPLSGEFHQDPCQQHPTSGVEYAGVGRPGQNSHRNSMAAMREMIFRIAAMQPVHIDPETVKPPKRKNVKISTDPQSVAARHRRERISERIRILQRLVPGGTKMDTASMLDEAIHYVKFLKNQVQSLERVAANRTPEATGIGFPVPVSGESCSFPAVAAKGYRYR